MKTEIKVIIFDWGNVLTQKSSNDSLYTFFKTSFRIDHAELKLVLDDSEFQTITLRKTAKEFWNEFASKKNIILPSNWFENLEKEKIACVAHKLNLEMIDLIKQLKINGYRVVMFSNIIKEMAALIRKAGHYDHFEDAILSCEIGYSKPNPKAYDILLSRINAKPFECMFIDDKKENIRAAQEKGIQGIVFQSFKDLKKQLDKNLIKY